MQAPRSQNVIHIAQRRVTESDGLMARALIFPK
jgi:hypothetical protein